MKVPIFFFFIVDIGKAQSSNLDIPSSYGTPLFPSKKQPGTEPLYPVSSNATNIGTGSGSLGSMRRTGFTNGGTAQATAVGTVASYGTPVFPSKKPPGTQPLYPLSSNVNYTGTGSRGSTRRTGLPNRGTAQATTLVTAASDRSLMMPSASSILSYPPSSALNPSASIASPAYPSASKNVLPDSTTQQGSSASRTLASSSTPIGRYFRKSFNPFHAFPRHDDLSLDKETKACS